MLRKLGHCLVFIHDHGSVKPNPQFIVRFYHTGEIRTVDQNDLKLYGNPSAGESLTPQIPDDLEGKEETRKEYSRQQITKMVTTIAEHNVDESLLPEKATILDVGCQGFQFTNYFPEGSSGILYRLGPHRGTGILSMCHIWPRRANWNTSDQWQTGHPNERGRWGSVLHVSDILPRSCGIDFLGPH